MESIVKLERVTKSYALGPATVQALNGVDLSIGAGEFTAIAGPSGSGKSTLLNLVSGLDRATSGRVSVAGLDTGTLSAAELSRLRLHKIGFVFQSYNLIPVLTALENTEYVLMLQGRPVAERPHQPQRVPHQVQRPDGREVAVVVGAPAGGAAIPALVRRHDAEPRRGQRRHHLAP